MAWNLGQEGSLTNKIEKTERLIDLLYIIFNMPSTNKVVGLLLDQNIRSYDEFKRRVEEPELDE